MGDADLLQRFLFEGTRVRGQLVRLQASWQAILERFSYPPVVRGLLGKALAAGALMGSTIKFSGALTLQIQGDGPLNLLVVQASRARTLRGMAQWSDEVPDAPLRQQFGNGRLTITLSPADGRERYQGIVDLGPAGLAAALEGYFIASEQLATRLWLAADASHAAGLLIQRMPGDVGSLAENAAGDEDWNRFLHLGDTLREQELLEQAPREILRRLYHEEDIRVFEPEPLSFRCGCSRQRIEETLRSLGAEDIESLLREQGTVKVDCQFCNQHYEFDAVDVERIFAVEVAPDVPKTRH